MPLAFATASDSDYISLNRELQSLLFLGEEFASCSLLLESPDQEVCFGCFLPKTVVTCTCPVKGWVQYVAVSLVSLLR